MNKRTGDKVAIEGDYQYNAYYNGSAPQRFWHYTKLKEAERLLNIQKGDRVLDVGSGSGLISSFIAKNYKDTYVLAIDGNPSAIKFASSKFKMPNLEYRLGLIDDLNVPDNGFDKIIFLEVIEHITQEQAAHVLREFHRILKPQGLLVISTPNRNSLWPLIEWTLDSLKLAPNLAEGQHEFLYTGKHLEKSGLTAGFKCIDRRNINTFSPWLAFISWKVAIFIHKMEFRFMKRFGSILIYTFQK